MIICGYCGTTGLPSTSRLIANGNREISPLCTLCANLLGIKACQTGYIEESGIDRHSREVCKTELIYPRTYDLKTQRFYFDLPTSLNPKSSTTRKYSQNIATRFQLVSFQR